VQELIIWSAHAQGFLHLQTGVMKKAELAEAQALLYCINTVLITAMVNKGLDELTVSDFLQAAGISDGPKGIATIGEAFCKSYRQTLPGELLPLGAAETVAFLQILTVLMSAGHLCHEYPTAARA